MFKLRFKIYTLGCKVNQYDSFDLRKKLISTGFRLVRKDANIAIINTCCVTQTAIYKCKRMINKARNENKRARIVVMGCWPKAYYDEVEKFGVDIIWKAEKLDKFLQKIIKAKELNSKALELSSLANTDAPSRMAGERARYFIKIQDGCEQFCSYCIIPYTRGKLRSRSMQEVINEVKQAVKAGYKEIVLCGIHLGLYGIQGVRHPIGCRTPYVAAIRRRRGEGSLVRLLKKLVTIKNLGRIRLSSIEVTEVSDELIKLIAKSNKICKHLHIPLQSGSDKILKLMNRPYKVKYLKNKIKKIRKFIPGIAITTDVMVGFPSETKKDFLQTCKFIKEMRFSRLHVFPFSAHEKTLAAKMPGIIKKQEIEQRGKKLRDLGRKLEKDYRKKFVGQELEVVVEKDIRCPLGHRMSKYIGKTEFYFDVEFSEKDIISVFAKPNSDKTPILIRSMLRVKV